MLTMLNMAPICCPVFFSEKIIAVFDMKKNLKRTPKTTKVLKFSNFQRLYAFYPQIFDGLCGLGRLKGSTRKERVVQYVFPKSLLQFL